MFKTCIRCCKVYKTYNRGRKFCSLTCHGKNNRPKGSPPLGESKKGMHLSPGTEFKKGVTPKNSLVFIKSKKAFKGSSSKYKNLHYKISKRYGKPKKCEECKTDNLTGRKIHWANISGKYKEVRSDWIRLCVKCHYYFDGQDKRKVRAK